MISQHGADKMSDDRVSINLAGIDAISLKGKRPKDEDYIIASSLENGIEVAVLLDGMGGGAAGEKASENGGKAFIESVNISKLTTESSRNKSLNLCIRAANMAVDKISAENQSRSGSTITAIVVKRANDGSIEWAEIAHVGDTRVYRIRDGEVALLSQDHSMTGEMVRAGYIELHQIEETHGKNVLTMSLGGPDELKPQVEPVDFVSGDIVLLCCDGIWGPLHTEEGMWLGSLSATEMANEALERGSTDNCSALFWTL